MKDIEKRISTFVENQFPAFYKEEGPKFISFITAYYEWLEEDGNALSEARKIPEYKDIDTTLEDFIIHFKEKYLRNIQFDTASNKVLLVKNALDLYRAKGTERSIDLFFKLVYGVPAEVKYPAEKILKTSDGIWERPVYLEIAYSRNNIDYVNKQIIGAKSGATAFVEKYIRRKTAVGYVDLLYVSNLTGSFLNNEKLGIKVNNAPVFQSKNSTLIGSIREVIIQDGGINFKIGDIVNLVSTKQGIGGLARVSSVNAATGVVDFILLESGFGYTLNADVFVSEKVISLENVTATSDSYFNTLEEIYQPLVNVAFSSATSNLAIGDTIFRYKSGNVVASGIIVDLNQESTTGTATISHLSGTFINAANYSTTSNSITLYANTIEDRTTTGIVIGVDTNYDIDIINQAGALTAGEFISQIDDNGLIARAEIRSIETKPVGSTLSVVNSEGSFQKISTISENSNSTFDISNIRLNIGLHDIRRKTLTFIYNLANNDNIINTDYIHQYSANGSLDFKGKVVTGTYSANSGNLTILPVSGYFANVKLIYTTSNTAKAVVTQTVESIAGGDFINSINSRLIGNTTVGNISSISTGSGAKFNVSTIGDQETIFVGTDLLNSNNVGYINYSFKRLNVTSNTGFTIGDNVQQKVNISTFNANTDVNSTTGFFSIASANTKFMPGDLIKYEVATGNTAISGFENGDTYYVSQSNSTGLILSYPYRHDETINSTSFSDFAVNSISETGHSFYKQAIGTIYNIGSGNLKIRNPYNEFGVSGASNSNVYNATVNTSINAIVDLISFSQSNTNYMGLSLREAAYGFPKNPQGDIKDTIYSCLSFELLNIGSIGGLSQIDPGSNYNIDPFVLIYQSQIAGYNRNDFLITISSPTASFTVGEKVNQTFANLVYYDLQVDAGVYGNTYNEISRNIIVSRDIDSATDFIYVPNITSTFNSNTSISNDFITILSNEIVDTSYVRYYTSTGNTALTGLANNNFYYVVSSNTSGFKLSLTSGGSPITLTPSITENGHFIVSHNNPFSNGTNLKYVVPFSNTAISGLANNELYYSVSSNTLGFKIANTFNGSPINIASGLNESHLFSTVPGYLPGDKVYQTKLKSFNSSTDVNNTTEFITITDNSFSNNDVILYYTSAGNTVVSGLTNATSYYVVSSNSTGIKLSNTINGTPLNLTAGISEVGHFISCQANATIQSVYTSGSNNFIRVKDINNTFATNFNITSYTYSNLSENVSSIAFVSTTSTAKGLIKAGSNSTVLKVKRLTFENTFKEGTLLSGDISSANATIISVVEDHSTLPIGLNALVSANVVTANGQVASLQVVDSGYGYSNSELVQFTSKDQTRAGTVKVIIDGKGIGKGYYRSSKGFLSADMKLHDGDYYQEYSYEILSKISFEKYSEMFKKVMHMAGTKVFGSASITERANVEFSVVEKSFSDVIGFNSSTDVDSLNNFIELDIEKYSRQLNPINIANSMISVPGNPYKVDDLLLYYTSIGNTTITGLSNNSIYYVIESNSNGIKLSNTANGSAISIIQGINEFGHYVVSYLNPFSNGDKVKYYTSIGNTTITGLSNNSIYYVANATPKGIKLANSSNVIINITNSANSEIGHYLNKTSEELLNVSN